ncbi:MAG: peptidase S41, partial [Muribaculaceae bacterium]|nr:peptidase S41 [Muribaculaceae bacterium]
MISLSRLLSRQIFSALLAVTSVFTLSSCHEHEVYADDGAGNFMQLWEIIDQHYCFFEEKDIDWAEVGRKYAAQLKGTMTYDEYFNILAAMLDELEDGHVNLSSTFNTSYYRKWWSDYPQDFNLRTLQQYYLDF